MLEAAPRILFCVAFLAAGAASADETTAGEGPQAQESGPAAAGTTAPGAASAGVAASAEEEPRGAEPVAQGAPPSALGTGLRVAAEYAGSAAGTLGIGFGTWYVACRIVTNSCASGSPLGLLAGMLVGAPLGAWAAGKLVGSNGTLLSALGGAAAGTLAVALMAAVASTSGYNAAPALSFVGNIGLLLPISLAVISLEWAHAKNTPTVLPMMAPGGGGLAVVGAF